MKRLYYVHDPMCSWCWAYRPVLDTLKTRLPDSISWRNLLGGLAPDSHEPMPPQTRDMVMNHWRRIQDELGTPFNFGFWTRCQPRRSTYPACRAVLAAAEFDQEEAMIDAIQRAYYLHAQNPSDEDTLLDLAEELGIDRSGFQRVLRSTKINDELLRQVGQARSWQVRSFPSLVLAQDGRIDAVPVNYRDAVPTLEAIRALLGGITGDPRPPQ